MFEQIFALKTNYIHINIIFKGLKAQLLEEFLASSAVACGWSGWYPPRALALTNKTEYQGRFQ